MSPAEREAPLDLLDVQAMSPEERSRRLGALLSSHAPGDDWTDEDMRTAALLLTPFGGEQLPISDGPHKAGLAVLDGRRWHRRDDGHGPHVTALIITDRGSFFGAVRLAHIARTLGPATVEQTPSPAEARSAARLIEAITSEIDAEQRRILDLCGRGGDEGVTAEQAVAQMRERLDSVENAADGAACADCGEPARGTWGGDAFCAAHMRAALDAEDLHGPRAPGEWVGVVARRRQCSAKSRGYAVIWTRRTEGS